MKIQTTTLDVERSGLQTESRFTIKATAKAFDILSSSLYSDKILAVVRELACNAHDSHVAAGKRDVPIEIRLPTALDPTFYVRDFGLGLSDFQIRGSWKHEDGSEISVEEGDAAQLIDEVDGWSHNSGIYTTYFDSSKTNSNDFIGQLGLGSKSPFSYATTFIVEAIFEGVKRVYTCFKDEQNMPAVARLDESPSDECNGVLVSIAVRPNDVDKFHTAAKKALMYFNPQPNIVGRTGFTPYTLKHTVQGNKWRIRDTEVYAQMTGAHVVQGFVAYPVDSHILSEAGLSGAAQALASTDVDLFVDIGNVETAASREALSYVPHTIQNLITAFEQAASEMRVTFQAEFDKCTSVWEVAMLLSKLEGGETSTKFGKIFKDMNRNQPFQWQGKDVSDTINLDLRKINCTQIHRMTTSRVRKSTRLVTSGTWHPENSVAREFEFVVNQGLTVVVGKEAKGGNDALKDYLLTRGNRAAILLIRPIAGKGMYDQGEINAILAMLGNPPTVDMSTLPSNKAVRGRSTYTPTKRLAEEKLVFTGFREKEPRRSWESATVHRKYSRLTWELQEIDLAAGGFYVELHRFEPVSVTGVKIDYLDDIISGAQKLGLIDDDVVVVGMNEKELNKLTKHHKNWVNLFDVIRTEFAEANKEGELYSGVVADGVFDSVGNGVRRYLVKEWDSLAPTVVDGPFKEMITTLAELNASAGEYKTSDVNELAENMGIRRETDDRLTTLPRAWNAMISKYEMLKLVTMAVDQSQWVKPVINYVNKIDMT